MKISIRDSKGKEYDGFIEQAEEIDIKNLSKQWKFNWAEIFQPDYLTFKLVKDDEIQGLLKLEWENEDYVIMKNVEVAPSNFYALLKGRRKFNTIIASKVGETFKIDPQLWMFIEAKNEMKEYECESQTHTKEYTLANLLNER